MVSAKHKRKADLVSTKESLKKKRPQRKTAVKRQVYIDDSESDVKTSSGSDQYNTDNDKSDVEENESGGNSGYQTDNSSNDMSSGNSAFGRDNDVDNDNDNGNEKENKNNDDDNVIVTTDDFKPPKIVIPNPKNSPFADAIAPASMTFLATLMENNDREFMRLHEDQWKATKKDFMDFVDLLAKELHQVDNTILVQPAKDAIYRLHRDLRFTKDRIPYKCKLMAAFTRQGKKSPLPGYHLSLQPGNESLIAVGIFSPPPILKQRMRSGIIRQGDLIREALSIAPVKQIFGTEKTGVELLNDSDRLKTAPKGIDKDHPQIELLRYNSLFVMKKFDDIEVVSEGFLDQVLDVCDALFPFITVLNTWLD